MYPEKWTQWEIILLMNILSHLLKSSPDERSWGPYWWNYIWLFILWIYPEKKRLFLLVIYWNIPNFPSSPVSLWPPMCHLFKSWKFQYRVHSFCIVVTCTTRIYWISPWVILFKCIHQTSIVQLILDHRCTWLVSWYHHPKFIF